MSTPAEPGRRLTRYATVAAVVVVALIAAVVSYSHMADLAKDAGEQWRSYLIPLSIDGLVVAASMVLLTRRRAGLPGGVLAWGALVAGVVASLAANMLDARPEVTAVLVAGWPAVAFAVAFELLLQQRRAERQQPAGELAPALLAALMPVEPTQLVEPSPAPPAESPVTPGGPPAAAPEEPPAPPEPSPAIPPAGTDIASQVRQLAAEGHGRVAIAKRLGITEHQARQAMGAVSKRPALRAVPSQRSVKR